jgi:hypothetical protein
MQPEHEAADTHVSNLYATDSYIALEPSTMCHLCHLRVIGGLWHDVNLAPHRPPGLVGLFNTLEST